MWPCLPESLYLPEILRFFSKLFHKLLLSYPGDVLMALGDLALESRIRDAAVLGRYVAGLWTNLASVR